MVDMQKGDFPKCMVGFRFEHMDDLQSPDTVGKSWPYANITMPTKKHKKKNCSLPDSLLESHEDAKAFVKCSVFT